MPPSRLLLAAAMLAAAPAWAEGGISLAVAASTIGAEPAAGVRLSSRLGAHGDAALLALSRHLQSGTTEDADHLKLRTVAAMVDLFPLGGALRLSAGARYEGEQAPAGLPPPALGRARARPGWTSIGPALTLGWARRFGHGLVAVMEGGTLFRRESPGAFAALAPSPLASLRLGWKF